MNNGKVYSLVLHILLFLVMWLGLPHLRSEIPPLHSIAVDIVNISEFTNVQEMAKSQKQDAPEDTSKLPKPKHSDKPDEEIKPKEKPKSKQEDTTKKEAEVIPTKKKEEKKEEKKEVKEPEVQKKKKKKESDDLDSLLKSLEENDKKSEVKDKKNQDDKEKNDKNAKSDRPFDASKPLSLSEEDAIRSQISKCWSIPAGSVGAESIKVALRINLEIDGAVKLVELANANSMSTGSNYYKIAAESAIRAVQKCSPLKNLPQDKYSRWKELELVFDPKDML